MRNIIFALTILITAFSASSWAGKEPVALSECDVQTANGHYRYHNAKEFGTFVFDNGNYHSYGKLSNGQYFSVNGTYKMVPPNTACSIVLSKQKWQLSQTVIYLTNVKRKGTSITAFSGVLSTGNMERIFGFVVLPE